MEISKEKSDIVVWENGPASGADGGRGGEATVREVAVGRGETEQAPVLRIVSSGFGERAVQGVSARRRGAPGGARMSFGRAA